jgi:putative ATPase
LNKEEIEKIIAKTKLSVNEEAVEWLTNYASGDARKLLSVLEHTRDLYHDITVENLTTALQSNSLRYDKKGEDHYNTVSAFIKSMRASQVDAALYYLARMVASGEDPVFIARRMVVFASEDVGLADPHALSLANAVFQAVTIIGYPECSINLSHGATYLAQAPKSRSSYNAYNSALHDVEQFGNLPIPLHLRNAVTKLMKEEGYGEGYEMYSKESYLPEKLKNRKYLQS